MRCQAWAGESMGECCHGRLAVDEMCKRGGQTNQLARSWPGRGEVEEARGACAVHVLCMA